jgi:hypothetical protein
MLYLEDKTNKETQSKILNEFFGPETAVKAVWDIEGQVIAGDWPQLKNKLEGFSLGSVVIGAKAGPEIHEINILHEMSHFVEIDEDRMGNNGWGLKVPSKWVYDRMCVEPTTLQITQREIRVMAYQSHLVEYVGADSNEFYYSVAALRFLPDYYMVPLEDGTMPYSENGRETELSLSEVEESRLNWIHARIQEQRSIFTLDRFMEEWKRRNKILLERLS